MKICIRCKLLKPLDEFGTYSRYPDGKHRYCRVCWNSIVNSKRHERGAKPIPPFLERLWGNVQQCGHEETCIYCCWPWKNKLDQDGYGKFSHAYAGRNLGTRVARVIYEVWHSVRIPDGMLACHYCDFPACCNPLHLWIGSFNDNRQDCISKGRHARGLTHGSQTMPHAIARGERQHCAKLKESDVRMVRTRYAQGQITAQRLADTYGVSKNAILRVLHRKTWKHVE